VKEFIPTNAEFELLLSALDAYVKEKVSGLMVAQYLKRMEGLTDEQAFMKAFEKKPPEIDQVELTRKTTELRDTVVLIAAKLVQLRNHYRDASVIGEIESLTK